METEYTCQYCKQSYQSDSNKKIFRTYKTGRIDYYDSTKYCSKECKQQEMNKRLKEFNKNHPEIIEKRIQKYKMTIRNNPEIIEKQRKSFQKTIQNRSKEDKQRIHENCKKAQMYSEEKRKEINNKIKETKSKNINIVREGIQKMKLTKSNKTPEEKEEIRKKRQITWNNKSLEEKKQIKIREINTKRNWSKEFKEDFCKRISNSLKKFHQNYPDKVEEMRKRNKLIFNSNQGLIDHIKEKGTETKLRHFKTAYKMSTKDFISYFKKDKKIFQDYLEDLYQKVLDKEIFISGHSPDEIKFYKDLLDIFEVPQIEFPFKLDKFEYDFFIKPLNLIIELNIFPTHGNKEFNKNNPEDINEKQRLLNNYKSLNFIDRNKLRIWANWDIIHNCDYTGASDLNKKATALSYGFDFKALYNSKEVSMFLDSLKQ